MNYIYFLFHFQKSFPEFVKIGGTKDYKRRCSEHLTSNCGFFLIFSCDCSFYEIEQEIKEKYKRFFNEHYHYKEGMVDDICKTFSLSFVTLCFPSVEYPFYDWMGHLVKNRNVVQKVKKELTLRRWQEEALIECKKCIVEKKNFLCEAATGSGKSFVIKKIAEELFKGIVIIITPQHSIVKSQQKMLKSSEYQVVKSGSKVGRQRIRHMTVMMFLSLMKNGYLDQSKVDCLIFDECHHVGGVETYKMIKKFDCFIAGFTATFMSSDPKSYDRMQKIFPEKNYEYNIRQAVVDGIITLPSVQVVSEKSFEKVFLENLKNTRHGRAIIYHKDNEKAINLYNSITCPKAINIESLEENIKKFENAKNPCVMLACQRYREGYDDPKLELAAKFGMGKKSTVQNIQIMGRLARKANKNNPIFMFVEGCYEDFIKRWFKLLSEVYGELKGLVVSEDGKMILNDKHPIDLSFAGEEFLEYTQERVYHDLRKKIYKDDLRLEFLDLKKKYRGYDIYCAKNEVKDVPVIYKKYWKGWHDFVGYDTSLFPKTVSEYKKKNLTLPHPGEYYGKDYYQEEIIEF